MPGKPFRRNAGWAVVVERERGPDGERRQRWLTGRTRREVEDKQAKLPREIRTGTDLDPTHLTVGHYLAHWLETVARPRLSIRGYESYERVARVHLIPALGAVPLARLGPAHLTRLYADLLDAGRAAKTIATIHGVLHAALEEAVRWQRVPRNVADVARPPRAERVPADLWDRPTLARFLAALAGQRFEALYLVALGTGMRQGELLGLRWRNVALDRGALAVREQLLSTRGRGRVVGVPKGRRARTISLDVDTIAVLRAHQARRVAARLALGAAWRDGDLVFPGEAGGPLPVPTLRSDWERRIARRGLPPMPFHGLRHLHATMLLEAGVHPKVVADRLGHSTTAITLEVYSHVTPTIQRGRPRRSALRCAPSPGGASQRRARARNNPRVCGALAGERIREQFSAPRLKKRGVHHGDHARQAGQVFGIARHQRRTGAPRHAGIYRISAAETMRGGELRGDGGQRDIQRYPVDSTQPREDADQPPRAASIAQAAGGAGDLDEGERRHDNRDSARAEHGEKLPTGTVAARRRLDRSDPGTGVDGIHCYRRIVVRSAALSVAAGPSPASSSQRQSRSSHASASGACSADATSCSASQANSSARSVGESCLVRCRTCSRGDIDVAILR